MIVNILVVPTFVMKASVLPLNPLIVVVPKYPVPAKYPTMYPLPRLSVATPYATSSPVPHHQAARRKLPAGETLATKASLPPVLVSVVVPKLVLPAKFPAI